MLKSNLRNRGMAGSAAASTLLMLSSTMLSAGAAESHPQLSNLPTLYITTEGGAPITSKEDYVTASIIWVDADGETLYENNLGIRGRGNSTWNLAKKPYRIKFDKKTEFLGADRAKAKSWTLLANFADKTLIRNAVASCIGTFAGQPFTAAARFVDVVLNGKYLGNYQISDQMEIREKRVNITEQEDPATEDSNITGGYFLEVDGFAYQEPVYITTPRGVTLTVKSPDEDVINEAQINYIRNHISAFENALFSADFRDPEKGYRKYVDPETLASWYIATELTGNVDGFWSTYIYKEKDDDKIYWGPLWDYDIAFNNCNRVGDVSRKLMTEAGFGSDLTKIWVKRMWEDEWFATLICDTWEKLVADGIEQHVCDYIDTLAAELEESQKLNFNLWPINRRDYNEIVLFNTYSEGIDYLKKFIKDHTEYLTLAFEQKWDEASKNPLPSKPFELDPNYYYQISNKSNGKNVIPGDAGLCIFTPSDSDEAHDWIIEAQGDCYTITNRSTGLRIADAAVENNAGYATGTQLVLTEADENDEAQKWKFVPVSTGNTYCIVNSKTSLAWNNSSGSSNDGNRVISWTNDSENENKPTRQWNIVKSKEISTGSGETNSIDVIPSETQYMVTYIPEMQVLRFLTEKGSDMLVGIVRLYDAAGSLLMETPVADTIDVSTLPTGVIIASWEIGSQRRSVKFVK